MNIIDWFFCVFTISAVLLEHVSDEQMHKFKDGGQSQLQFLRQNLARLRDEVDTRHRQLQLLDLELDNIEYSETFNKFEERQKEKYTKK